MGEESEPGGMRLNGRPESNHWLWYQWVSVGAWIH